ncbi:MAG: Roadblock/LC7 domain [Planctomycetota bacterium]|jgi:predicted regulator of Ras-like GTPase activity (Roadblock/LC7/MglB family)
MNRMQDTMAVLRELGGVRGCVVVTLDGLIVAKSLDAAFRQDAVAALSSFLMQTTERALHDNGMEPLTTFVLQANYGKAVFVRLENSYLVVLLDQFTDVRSCREDIDAAAAHLRRLAQIA